MEGLYKAFDEAGIDTHSVHTKAHGWTGVVNVDPGDSGEAADVLRENGYRIHSFEELVDNVDRLLEDGIDKEPTPFTRIKFSERDEE